MKSNAWLRYFEAQQKQFIEPQWDIPCPLEPATRDCLAHSLSHFQLSETGGGSALFKKAEAQVEDDADYQAVLRLFIGEDAEHARLLGELVRRFGGDLIQRHWTHFLFRAVRRALGLNFEIQTLLIAELVGTAYYRLLHRRARDPILDQVLTRILEDEAQHVAFHLDHLRETQALMLPAARAVSSLQFQALFSAARWVAWIDHGRALEHIGGSREEFFLEARRECIRFLAKLEAAEWPAAFTIQPVG